ncbi:MAG: glycosyltransferase family 2 protein [Terriglobales bacterium]
MKWIFWGSAAVVAYTYAGYAGWLWLCKHWRLRPVRRAPFTPRVSLVMVVRNEAEIVERKLQNLMQLNYPQDLLEIIVVSDGSTDATNDILSAWSGQHASDQAITNFEFRELLRPDARGKAACVNDAVAAATGEIVVFTDARQRIERDSLRLLVENFADPYVGCASGELMLGDPESGESVKGMGLYWRIEKNIRELESSSGSVVGATGALYAARRSLIVALPPETILDDVYIPMHVARQGLRVILDSRAVAWDLPDLGASREFARKVRTLSGNYQLIQLAPWILTASNPLRFEFVSHKLLRLAAPLALAGVLFSSMLLPQPVYRIAFILQLGFYTLSLLAIARIKRGPIARLADASLTFVMLNTAALVAFTNFVTGKKAVWIR